MWIAADPRRQGTTVPPPEADLYPTQGAPASMFRRIAPVIVLAGSLTALLPATPALATGSYSGRLEASVRANPQMQRVIHVSMSRTGWKVSTPAGRRVVRQAYRVVAGESGFTVGEVTGNCYGLFQIQNGERYGRWTAKDLRTPRIVRKYTIASRRAVRGVRKDGTKYRTLKRVVLFAPRVGQLRIFNPVINAEVAHSKFRDRGWQPWVVAHQLGYV
jgi:hypothetical protein